VPRGTGTARGDVEPAPTVARHDDLVVAPFALDPPSMGSSLEGLLWVVGRMGGRVEDHGDTLDVL